MLFQSLRRRESVATSTTPDPIPAPRSGSMPNYESFTDDDLARLHRAKVASKYATRLSERPVEEIIQLWEARVALGYATALSERSVKEIIQLWGARVPLNYAVALSERSMEEIIQLHASNEASKDYAVALSERSAEEVIQLWEADVSLGYATALSERSMEEIIFFYQVSCRSNEVATRLIALDPHIAAPLVAHCPHSSIEYLVEVANRGMPDERLVESFGQVAA